MGDHTTRSGLPDCPRPGLASTLLLLAPALLFAPSASAQYVDATSGPLGSTGFDSGVAWGDYDGDGDIDLYVAGDGKLFRNDSGGAFVDAPTGSVGEIGYGNCGVWGDYDNDRDLDLHVANYDFADQLFRNDGGSFVDVTTALLEEGGEGAAWADYDRDGDLDLYVASEVGANKLFRNDGATFVDATHGPLGDTGAGTGLAWGDYDNDGDPDLYLSNFGTANKLFRNDGGTFVDATSGPLGDTGNGRGVAWGDYDNDGDLDLYHARWNQANKLFRNDGGGTFADVTSAPLDNGGRGTGVSWGDYDNDGDLDIFLVNWTQSKKLFRNDGGGAFADVTASPLGDTGSSWSSAFADYDQDGDLDIYLSKFGEPNKLFRNDISNGNHWLHVKLRGTLSNRDGIGARVRAAAGGVSQIREVSGGSGHLSQDSLPVEFGLGSSTSVDTLEITWPSGLVQRLTSVAADREVTVEEGWTDATNAALADTGFGEGVAWGDYDNDGDLDLYLSNFYEANKLFRNDAGTFVDATSGPLGDTGPGTGVAWGDYDNDGDLDLYLGNGTFSPNKLFRNDAGTLVDATSGPLGYNGNTRAVAWGDYDLDGDLDLYLVSHGLGNKLLRNDGAGTFADVTTGLLGYGGDSFGAAWGDYDNDGDLDIYLANNAEPNKLFRNDGGSFVDATSGPLGDTGKGVGVSWGDYDNDRDLDIYLSNWGSGDKLFRNDGSGSFANVTAPPLGGSAEGLGSAWGDYDNDGDLDLYVANHDQANRLFRNEGAGVFADATPVLLQGVGGGAGVAWGDYDGDGDLDLYLANQDTTNQLFRNDLSNGNHWLHVKLAGTLSNRNGIGARVRLVAGGVSRIQEVSGGSGYLSQNSLTVEFGLGAAATIDTVEIRWPSGILQRLATAPAPDQTITVVEEAWTDVTSGPLGDTGEGTGVAWGDYDNDGDLDLYLANDGQANKLFRNDGGGAFVDATSGPLGDTGPGAGVEWGDYDNDGDLDLYLVNYGAANKLFRNDGGGAFVDATSGPLGGTGPGVELAWGDYDNDGDLDLYLVNYGAANKLLRNDGAGGFVDATSGPLGDTGQALDVARGDYDNDGDQDLYLVKFEEANKLFRNDGGGVFVDATSGPLGDTGPGYGAAWGDYDNDGDLDLYLAREYEANRLFRNDGGGAFVDATSGPLGDTGPGYGATWGDYDNDGDLDLYLVNFGVIASNKLFRNDGGGTFVDATSGPLGDTALGVGVAWGDYDNDGDLDLYLSRYGQANKLFRNDLSNGNHWLHVKLVGRSSNRDGIGARVRVAAGGVSRIQEISVGSGLYSQNSIPAEFGLGSATVVDTLKIRWPSGIVQDTFLVAADQVITITEPPLIVPDVLATIQAALDAASDGDTVFVQAGTYTGPGNKNLDFGGTDIVLLAPAGPESTTIDCAGIGRGFTLSSGETPAAVVRGFSVVNGAFEGGAANLFHASPTFVNCIFQGHVVSELSAPGRVTLASPQVPERGGALVIEGGAPTFTDCLIVDNTADIAGAIVASDTASATFTRCTIAGNRTLTSSAGILIEDTASLQFIRSIVWGNCEDEATVAATAFVDFDTCVVDSPGVVGPGSESYSTCIFANPRFCAPTVCDGALTPGGDYTLDNGSPALPGVNPWSVLIGTLGQGCTTVVNVWTGAGDATSWEDDDNWSGAMPQDGDDVVIPDVAATSQVVYSTAWTTSIDSLTCEERFRVTGDTLAVEGPGAFIATLNLAGGTLAGSGTTVALDSLVFESGTLHGTGTLIVNGRTQFSTATAKTIRGGRVLMMRGTADWVGSGSILHGDGELGTKITFGADPPFPGGEIPLTFFFIPGRRVFDHIDVSGGDPAVFENTGTMQKSAADTAIFEIDVTQDGTLNVSAGVADFRLAFSNFSSARLAGGTYNLLGTLRFSGAAIETCASTIVLDGTESAIRDLTDGNALGGLSRNTGSITLKSGRSLSTSTAFTNAGTFRVEDTSSFTVTGAYTQTAGLTMVKDTPSLITAASFAIDAGSVQGTGSLSTGGLFVNNGVIRPGGSPGTIRITGDYQQTSTGVLEIELGGYVPGTQFDVVEVTGSALLDGLLVVELVNGFNPVVADTFDFFSATEQITGTFDEIESFSLDVSVPMTTTVASIAVNGLHPRFIGASGGSWLTPSNWSGGLPGLTKDVLIDRVVVVNGPGAQARYVRVIPPGDLRIQNGGLEAQSLDVRKNGLQGGKLSLMNVAALLKAGNIDFEPSNALQWSSGTILLDGGLWTQANDTLDVGDSADLSALVLVNGAQAVVPGVVRVGVGAGDQGRIEVGSGSSLVADVLEIGRSGEGEVSANGTVTAGLCSIGPIGTLYGGGSLAGSLINEGVLAPGDSVGVFSVLGDYTQLAGGTLEIHLRNATTADRLDVAGQATLGGTLRIRELSGFPLDPEGLEFQVLTYGNYLSEFHGITTWWGVGDGDSLIVSPSYGSTQLVVTVVQRIGAELEPSRPFRLFQNFPNPFRASTAIQFDLPEPGPVSLRVFDVNGRLVRTLAEDAPFDAGRHQVSWDARDQGGDSVAAGIYFFRLRSGQKTEVRRMVLLK